MEDSSNELIEQIISKEKYCFDNTNIVVDNINSTREPLSPHPTKYNSTRDIIMHAINVPSEKVLVSEGGSFTQPTVKEVTQLEVAVGAYSTPPQPSGNISKSTTTEASDNSNDSSSSVSEETPLPTKAEPSAAGSSTPFVENNIINPLEISDHERENCAEWFMGKPAKTPERYMRIRNHILDCWEKTKPNYLTKTAGRKNLSSCGDVNAVGRIHVYLEKIQAINVNCTNPVKRVYGKKARTDDESPRKKAKKTPGFVWEEVDDEDTSKDTANNGTIIRSDGNARPKRTIKRPELLYNESSTRNDPFTLVPVNRYSSENKAPFTVSITSEALLIMDFHSHLSSTEVIGLLGGVLNVNESNNSYEIEVTYVFPCKSASTGIECEMDPASEIQARELFSEKGLSVVGWYHSHPTFDPEPSNRDIENQTSYQELFRLSSGVEPFIGVIITPYNINNVITVRSQIQVIHINNYFPFACVHNIIPSKIITEESMDIITQLVLQYKEHRHKVDLNLKYGHVLKIDKLMNSMNNHIFMDQDDIAPFLSNVKNLLKDF